MHPLRTTLAIALTLLPCLASAAPPPRTAQEWATLCRGAQRPDSLGTIPLLRTQTRALATSLKSAGYPAGWHQDLASVLVDHGDGTCGHDNRAFLQLSPKDPEGDLDGNGIIDTDDPFPDGALFTDPSVKVPNSYVWSAKFASAGAQLYLPPIAETPTKIAAERDQFIALAQTLCTDSGRAWNAVVKTCEGKTPPRISETSTPPPPRQSVVAGTVNATPVALIAVALLGWLLFILMFYMWWNADHSERDNALLRTGAAEQLRVEMTQQRDEARMQISEQATAHDQAMDQLLAQAVADAEMARAKIAQLTAELEDAHVELSESDELLAQAEGRHAQLEEATTAAATTLRRERAEAQVDTQRALEVAREQQRVLLMISRGGTSQLTRVSKVLEAMDAGLHGADYFLRVKCPRPGKGERAGKTPRDKVYAELTTMMTTLRTLLPTRSRNGRHAAVPAQAQTAA